VRTGGHSALVVFRMSCSEERILIEIIWSCLSMVVKDGGVM
jgi:hypothetical protein